MGTHVRRIALVCLCLLLSLSASAVEVNLTVAEPAGVARTADGVTTGVPFANGVVEDVSVLTAMVGGRPVPAQFLKTVPWPDGSVRWALMDLQIDVPANGQTEVTVTDANRNPAPDSPVTVEQDDATVTVSTGPMTLVLDKQAPGLFNSIQIDGAELFKGGRGLVLYMPEGEEILAGPPDSVEIEQAGPMRTTIAFKGVFPNALEDHIRYTVRVTAYSGQRFVKVHAWLENQGRYGYDGQAEWLNFDGLAVEYDLDLPGDVTARCEGVTASHLKVEQLNPEHRYASFEYHVYRDGERAKSGERTDGIVEITYGGGRVVTAVRHFWENYEKAIEVNPQKLTLWLWPRNGQWPRDVRRGASANEFSQFAKDDLYALPGGTHKGYEFILDFSDRSPEAAAATLNAPLMALATPEYYATTEAAPGWFAPADFRTGNEDYDTSVLHWNQRAADAINRDSNTSLYAARNGRGDRRGFWYGWMDFGDLCWQPGTSQLHYDWTWAILVNYLRQGQRGFIDMSTEMARHRIDVDQIWSDRVRPQFRGLTRYEKQYTNIHGGVRGGWFRPIPSHHWSCGVVLYYMLTGEPKAREAAIRSANGVVLRQVNSYRNEPSTRGQLRSSGWAILVLCSTYDLTGDQHWLDEAMVLFNHHFVPLWEDRGPLMGGGLQLYYSLDGLTRLHHRTGNEQLLRLLREIAEAEFSGRDGGEWLTHFTNLYGYLALVDNNEDYLAKAVQYFNAYTPSRPNPPAFTNTGAWTKEVAKRLRNGHILQYVQWKMQAEDE